jgi:thioredoxin 1
MSNSTNVVTLTSDNFQQEVIDVSGLVLVDFWAAWCGPCRLVDPVVREIANDFTHQVKVAKLNIDDHAAIATQYGITAIPTLLFFQNGKIVDRQIGAAPKAAIADKLSALLHQATATGRATS